MRQAQNYHPDTPASCYTTEDLGQGALLYALGYEFTGLHSTGRGRLAFDFADPEGKAATDAAGYYSARVPAFRVVEGLRVLKQAIFNLKEKEHERRFPTCKEPSAGNRAPTWGQKLQAIAKELISNTFCTPEGTPYAEVICDGHFEVHCITSSAFEELLLRRAFEEYRDVPNNEAIKSATKLLVAEARFAGSVEQVFIRVGEHDGNIYVDLGDADWRAIKITPNGWSITEYPPINFVRPGKPTPLPVPQPGDQLVNFASSSMSRLILTGPCFWDGLLAHSNRGDRMQFLTFREGRGQRRVRQRAFFSNLRTPANRCLEALLGANLTWLFTQPKSVSPLSTISQSSQVGYLTVFVGSPPAAALVPRRSREVTQ